MKRICFFSGDITRGGGTESVAVLIANGLARQGKYEIIFLSLVEQQRTPFFPVCSEIHRYHLGEKWIQPGPGYLAVLPKLRRFLKEQEVDVLVDIDIVLDILSLPVRRGLGTRVVSWGHFSYYFEQESLYRRWILKWGAKRADYCVTINEENRRCYERYLHRSRAVRTIYNPAVSKGQREKVPGGSIGSVPEMSLCGSAGSVQEVRPCGSVGSAQEVRPCGSVGSAQEVRPCGSSGPVQEMPPCGSSGPVQEMPPCGSSDPVQNINSGAVTGERYILWAGRLTEIKGVDYLAETAESVLKALPDWKWLVAGEGEMREWLEEYICSHGLRDRLVLLGRVKDLEPYYCKAGIFVLTSHSEGLPMCLLEAKSYGLPCVSFNIRTGPDEIIRDGVNGYLVEPYDCGKLSERILELASDEGLREQFARNAALDMEKFDLEHILKSWNEVFESLCG